MLADYHFLRNHTKKTIKMTLERARKAAEILSPDKIFLNPDCGFGTFSERSVNSINMAFKKLCALSEAVQELRK